jgi:hypothetical protein
LRAKSKELKAKSECPSPPAYGGIFDLPSPHRGEGNGGCEGEVKEVKSRELSVKS